MLVQTRSGREWGAYLGEPVRAVTNFNMVQAMACAMDEYNATAPENFPLEGLRDVRMDAEPSPPPATTPQVNAHALYNELAETDKGGAPAGPRTLEYKMKLAPELFRFYRKSEQGLPAYRSDASKHTFQQNSHKKKKRKFKRAAIAAKDELLGATKSCALKHQVHLLGERECAATGATNACHQSSLRSGMEVGPIYTPWSLDRANVPLAHSCHIGRLLPVTDEDRQRVGLEDLPKRSLTALEWDGR